MGEHKTKTTKSVISTTDGPQITVGAPDVPTKTFRHFMKRRGTALLSIVAVVALLAVGGAFYRAHTQSDNRAKQAVKDQTSKQAKLTGVGGSKEFDSPTVRSDASSADKAANEAYLGSKNLDKHDYKTALSHYEKAVAYAPDNAALLYTTGDVATKASSSDAKKYYTLAYKAYVKTVETDAGSPIFKYSNVAGLAEKIGDTGAAKMYYQKVLDSATAADKQNEQLAPVIERATQRLKALS